MNKLNIRIPLIGLIILYLVACEGKNTQTEYSKLHSYSILIEKYDNLNQAIKFISESGEYQKKLMRIEQNKKKEYQVLLGQYINSSEAGENAYNLLTKGSIKKYSIVHNNNEVLDEFINVL